MVDHHCYNRIFKTGYDILTAAKRVCLFTKAFNFLIDISADMKMKNAKEREVRELLEKQLMEERRKKGIE